MIRDLETQLLRVGDGTARAYMGEAVRCYNAAAFRAAVVAALAAGMNDLRVKLGELASGGGATLAIKTAVAGVETRFKNQEVYERAAVDVAENEVQMLAPAEAKAIRGLLDLRNLCAHPSGHQGSAEEARFAIVTVIDLIMSRPSALGMVGVTQIVSRLSSTAFFPKADLPSVRAAVAAELVHIHTSLFPALVSKVVEVIETEIAAAIAAGTQTLSQSHKNALFLLKGMVAGGGNARDAVWSNKRFSGLVHAGPDRADVLFVFTADISGLSAVDALTRARALQLLRGSLRNAVGRRVARAAIEGSLLSPDELDDLFNAAHGSLIGQWTADTPAHVLDLGWRRLEDAFFDALVERCGSGTFATANPAIDAVQAMSPEQFERMGDARQSKYLVQISRVGLGMYPARSADAIVQRGLGARAGTVDALMREWARDPTSIRELRPNWEALGRILHESGRVTDVNTLLQGFANEPLARRPLDLLAVAVQWPETRAVARPLQTDAPVAAAAAVEGAPVV